MGRVVLPENPPEIREELLEQARSAKGFMPDTEGQALYRAGIGAGREGPMLEIGTYCGKSALYFGAAACRVDQEFFTVDHHRGSEENQPGWEHHDPEVVDEETGLIDTLPFFRRNVRKGNPPTTTTNTGLPRFQSGDCCLSTTCLRIPKRGDGLPLRSINEPLNPVVLRKLTGRVL